MGVGRRRLLVAICCADDLALTKSEAEIGSRSMGGQLAIFQKTQFLSRASTVSTMRKK